MKERSIGVALPRALALLAALMLATSSLPSFVPPTTAAHPTCLVSDEATGVGYRDLNVALSSAATGATLVVKGTCTPGDLGEYPAADFAIWRDVTLKGVSNKVFGTPTLLGSGEQIVVRVIGAKATLIGLTITGARVNNSTGGLFNEHGNVTLSRVTDCVTDFDDQIGHFRAQHGPRDRRLLTAWS